MGEYSRTENGQNGETDWDLRSILRDLAKSGWVILLIACSAAMVTYTVLIVCHRDRYTVKTTFAVMGRGENASAASSLAAMYDMTQKFEAILENSILKKKVTEELKLSSFPAKMSASIVPESNLMELSVTADSPQTAFRILKSVLENYTSVSDYIIPAVVLETLQLPQLFNILKGDMALVGPRPALWNQKDLFLERERYGANDVRPGLTGWAQIHGRDELPIREKAELDGYYVQHMHLGMDLACLWKTAGSVLRQEGIHEGTMEKQMAKAKQ